MAQISQTSNEGPTSHRKIQKVPKLLLKEKRNKSNYIPKVVSIGPYHHGKPELLLAESFKPTALEMVFQDDKRRELDCCYDAIKIKIINIRNCYEKDPTDSYSDDELVRMMFLDACFIMIHIETSMPPLRQSDDEKRNIPRIGGFMFQTLGMLTTSIVLQDMFLLENQIPFWILKLVLSSRYNKDESEELLNRYMTISLFGEFRSNRNLPAQCPEELHLLEAFHRLVVFGFVNQPKKTCLSFIKSKFLCCCKAKEKIDIESGVSSQGKSRLFKNCNEGDRAKGDLKKFFCLFLSVTDPKATKGDLKKFFHSFRSVTDLKANGIHFKPSQTLSLKDVKFESNCIYAKLQLPIWYVTIYTKVFFLNMIAYELSPNNLTHEAIVTAYINLMKLLIVKHKDVKELRDKKILLCSLGNDGQILKVYQDISTYADYPLIFQDVKDKIEAHYNSRTKTWIAEFIYTHFRSPWSVAALFAATCILFLTVLQTIYTMKSYYNDN